MTTPRKKRLYLFTEPHFARDFVCWTIAGCLGIRVASQVDVVRETAVTTYFAVNQWMLGLAHQYAWWSLLGLLSSSCCALQLILNSISWGCAGFNNTWLGPLRPVLLAATVLLQASAWYVAWDRPWQWFPTAVSTLWVVVLSLLPEALVVLGGSRRSNRVPPATHVLRFDTSRSVGCAACLATVRRVLQSLTEVEDFDAHLETATLRVTCQSAAAANRILEALEDAGFPVDLLADEKQE